MALLGAEVIARWAYPLDTGTSWEYRIPHPRFGWVLAPGASYVYRLAEDSVPVSYNAEGWRDLPHAKDKAEGVVRVLVLGDSFMEAFSVRFEDSLPARLEHLISPAGRRVEVINFGVGGYSTLQEYLVFSAVGRAYQPDVVVLAMFLRNDLRENSQELASLIETNLKAQARPFLDPQVNEPGWRVTQPDFEGALQRFEEHRRWWANRLLRQSALLRLGQQALERLSRHLASASPDREYLANFGQNYCSQPLEYKRSWGVTRRILTRLNSEVSAAGARLLVMAVPAIEEIDEDVMARVVRDAPQADRLCLEEAPAYWQLGKLLRELDIDYLDLLPAFRDARRQTGVELFRRSDDHWNPQGHALAARELAAALERRGYLVWHGADFASDGKVDAR
jgi:lysophospholipase L1-like esterase